MAAGQANRAAFIHVVEAVLRRWANRPEALLDLGALLLDTGNLQQCEQLMLWCHQLAPQSPLPLFNLANVWLQTLRQEQAIDLYSLLHQSSNLLMAFGYLPGRQAAEARALAERWAAEISTGCKPSTTPPQPSTGVRRIGFLSADLCQHPVGLFLWPLAEELAGRAGIELFFYDNSPRHDWLTERLKACGRWRQVTSLHDAALAAAIRADQLSTLIDLGGHTARSRLAVVLQRPTARQLSWLGYWATTGLTDALDGVLVDKWVVPPQSPEEQSFCEPVLRLPEGRWCYRPVPWMPEVVDPPCLHRGWITFGSFNTSSKLNDRLLRCWASVLHAVPNSRLLLKNYQLQDSGLQAQLKKRMASLGVNPQRLELQGPSFHAELLATYSQVDIALDPFPFNGGLTSCEALWLGLPLVTLAGNNQAAVMAARQGVALLSQIGREEWIADCEESYVAIAARLAASFQFLQHLRHTQRKSMLESSLCDATAFADGFLQTLDSHLETTFNH